MNTIQKYDMYKILRCPIDRGMLDLSQLQHNQIMAEKLICKNCGESYLVTSGVTDFLFRLCNQECFDVGIIPFKFNEIIQSLNLLKLYKFIADGCRVIATDILGLRKFSDLIGLVINAQEFDCLLKKALTSDVSRLKKRLKAEAKCHSRDSRTGEMLFGIQECLVKKCRVTRSDRFRV